MAKKPAAIAATTAATGAALNPAVLFKVGEATKTGGHDYVTREEGEGLVAAGLIEVNFGMLDPNNANRFAARATDAGMKFLAEGNEADASAPAAAVSGKPVFAIDDNVPLAPRRGGGGGGGGGRESIYPFDALNVGQSFHVPKSAENENPARTMATAVSQAVRKHAVEDGYELEADGVTRKKNKAGEDVIKWKPTKVFTVRAVGKDDPRGEGARVYRTA